MNKSMRVLVLGLILATAILMLWMTRPQPLKTNGPVISGNIPLTGPLAIYGTAIKRGVEMGFEEAASTTTSLMRVDWQDNTGDPKVALTVVERQSQSKPDIYLSSGPAETKAIGPRIAELGIPHFVWMFDAKINSSGTNNFRTLVNYKIEPPVYVGYAKKIAAQRIAILYVQVQHTTEEVERYLVPQLREAGITQLLVEGYAVTQNDFKDVALKVKAYNPDLIIVNGFENNIVAIIRALRPIDAISDKNTLVTYDLMDAAAAMGVEEIEGLRVIAPKFITKPGALTTEWRNRYLKRFGEEPKYLHAYAYDMALAIHTAALSEPKSPLEWTSALKSVKVDGVTGLVSFDEDGDIATELEVGVFRNGRVLPDGN